MDLCHQGLETRIGLQIWIFFTYLGMATITALIYLQGMNFLPVLPLPLLLSVMILVTRRIDRPVIN
ncbi:MAG TPA: hypothetical protein VFX43_09500 [Chitinophagaceae bacterium]|nr:hypothetical protein [Chitinophagaceae bacterium]